MAGLMQHIHHLVALQVTAFEQHSCRTQSLQIAGRCLQVRHLAQGAAQQQGSLVQIRRHHLHPWKQFAHQHRHSFLGNQAIATGGHHHRVEHHVVQLVMVNRPGHHLDDVRRMQHADLDGVDANVIQHRLQLRLQKRRWHAVDGLHPLGVLRGERGDGGHAVAAQSAEGFQIGLDACAAAAVRTGNRQHAKVLAGEFMCVHGPDYVGVAA